jgi:release factor glutamine methyltransferase
MIPSTVMTILEILNLKTRELKGHRIENPRLNAELLLAHAMKLSREGLYTHLHCGLGEKEREDFEQLFQRRLSGEPLQYVLGKQEFWSIDLKVDPRVLIPRPETELLVDQALSVLSQGPLERKPVVLEIGTGSGAIAISIAKGMKAVSVIATDISMEALCLARENAERTGAHGQIRWVRGDLFSPFRKNQGFDLILSNPPYVARSAIRHLSREVQDFEPLIALDGGEDGLDFYRKIISQASCYLRQGGWLLLEIGQGQGSEVSKHINGIGHFSEPRLLQDLSGIDRVVKAQKLEAPACA